MTNISVPPVSTTSTPTPRAPSLPGTTLFHSSTHHTNILLNKLCSTFSSVFYLLLYCTYKHCRKCFIVKSNLRRKHIRGRIGKEGEPIRKLRLSEMQRGSCPQGGKASNPKHIPHSATSTVKQTFSENIFGSIPSLISVGTVRQIFKAVYFRVLQRRIHKINKHKFAVPQSTL